MGRFIIEGGNRLCGEMTVSGSKNAALPIIFASIITCGISEITNLPDIEDVRVAIELVRELGGKIERVGSKTYIDTSNLRYIVPSSSLTNKIRASTYLLGSELARFGRAEILKFGGCNFSLRPIDMHLSALESFGASILGNSITIVKPHNATVIFRQKSVGATVNALIFASSIEGESTLVGAAREPHIDALIEFLLSAGAHIHSDGDVIKVSGGRLGGGRVTIPGDMIEAGTYLAMSLATDGDVKVGGVSPCELSSFLDPFIDSGSLVTEWGECVSVSCRAEKRVEIFTAPYPGFPTDLQPIAAPIMALGAGGVITDTVWPERFGYLNELGKMGVHYQLFGNTAEIYPSEIHNGTVRATDLRGGAAMLISALASRGQSEILSAELLMRGYEQPTEKLARLGAKIKYVDG